VRRSSIAFGRSSSSIRISASRVTLSRKMRVMLTTQSARCRWKSGSITVLEDGTIRPMRKVRFQLIRDYTCSGCGLMGDTARLL
jgi:hypothetical protein